MALSRPPLPSERQSSGGGGWAAAGIGAGVGSGGGHSLRWYEAKHASTERRYVWRLQKERQGGGWRAGNGRVGVG